MALARRGKKIAYEVALGLHFIHGLKCASHNTNLPSAVALMACCDASFGFLVLA